MKRLKWLLLSSLVILTCLIGLSDYALGQRRARSVPKPLPCKQVQVNATQAVQVCGNNATITIITPKRNPTDPFPIYLICEENNQLSVKSYTFPLKDVSVNDNSPNFPTLLAFLNKLPGCNLSSELTVFRLSDEKTVESNAKISAIVSDGNLGIVVVPNAVMKEFESSHFAFVYFKSFTDQLSFAGGPLHLPCAN